MPANVVRVNSEYKIQCVEGGQIVLDTGRDASDNIGTVLVLGNLDVRGDATVFETTNVSIQDIVLTLNDGETGNGVSGSPPDLRRSGLEINRGTATSGDARWIWDETQSWKNPDTGLTTTGLWISKTQIGGLNGIQTNSITTGTTGNNLYLLNNGTAVVSVTGTNNYERQVLDYSSGLTYIDADIIPNIKSVTDKITYDLTFKPGNRIRRGDTQVEVYDDDLSSLIATYTTAGASTTVKIIHDPIPNSDINITTSSFVTISGSSSTNLNGVWPVTLASPTGTYFNVEISIPSTYTNLPWTGTIRINSYNSNAVIKVNNVSVATFYQTNADLYNLHISGSTIGTLSSSSSDLILQATSTGVVQINDALKLTFQSAPTAVSNTTQIYSAANTEGQTGLYFVNTHYSDELISKQKALAWSLLF
jgi:hypothetical protein